MHKLDNLNWYARRSIFLGCLLMMLTIAVGCSEDTLTSNNILPALNPDSAFGDPSEFDSLITSGSPSIFYGAQLVSPDSGGKVSIQVGNSTQEFTVPAGVVAQQTDISVAVRIMDITKLTLMYDFQPDGLQFTKPAELKITYPITGIFPDAIHLYWHNPATGNWEYETSVNIDSLGFIRLPINHFSKYGVSE